MFSCTALRMETISNYQRYCLGGGAKGGVRASSNLHTIFVGRGLSVCHSSGNEAAGCVTCVQTQKCRRRRRRH